MVRYWLFKALMFQFLSGYEKAVSQQQQGQRKVPFELQLQTIVEAKI